MFYRKSLIKKWLFGRFGLGSITKKNFVKYATRFTQIFEKVCGPSTVRIELYAKAPYFTSFMGSDKEREIQKSCNEEGMIVVAELSELPEDFSTIPYVKMLVHPKDESKTPLYAFGVVDFGSHLSSHIIFYAQPEEVAKAMEEQLFLDNIAPSGFSLGDGLEENARRYVPTSVISTSVMPGMLRTINYENRVPLRLLRLSYNGSNRIQIF